LAYAVEIEGEKYVNVPTEGVLAILCEDN